MDIILLPGLWLRPGAWVAVADELRRLGHQPVAVALPGQGDGRADATLQDQLKVVVAAVDAVAAPPLVVGHSAAAALAWMVADARPDVVTGVVMIGGHARRVGKVLRQLLPARRRRDALSGLGSIRGS